MKGIYSRIIWGLVVGCLSIGSMVYVVHAAEEGLRIALAITPIKESLDLNPGETTAHTVTLYNNSDQGFSFYMSDEDCVPDGNFWAPKCTPKTGTGIDPTKLSSWIKFQITGLFNLAPHSSKAVGYTIAPPANATPGGHYGAIFFNNPVEGTGGNVGVNRRIGMLLMVTVSWAIVNNTEIGAIQVSGNGGPASGNEAITTDSPGTGISFNSPSAFVDSLGNLFRGLLMTFSDPEDLQNAIDPFWDAPTIPQSQFDLSLKFPVDNQGNTHIIPTGQIALYDASGNQLKSIGKTTLTDGNNTAIGEKIVDYLPVNDIGGAVLPDTERVFDVNWFGFASEQIGADGKPHIVYQNPAEYFGANAQNDMSYIYPWDKLAIITTQKSLTASGQISYVNPADGTTIVRDIHMPITVHYSYIGKTLNTGLILVVVLLVILFWILLRRRDTRIDRLEHTIIDAEGEIAILEAAARQSGISIPVITKKSAKKKPTPVVVPPARKKASPAKKPAAAKTTPVKKASPAKKPSPTKAPGTWAKTVKKTPVKKPAPKAATPVKKTPAKRPTKTTKK